MRIIGPVLPPHMQTSAGLSVAQPATTPLANPTVPAIRPPVVPSLWRPITPGPEAVEDSIHFGPFDPIDDDGAPIVTIGDDTSFYDGEDYRHDPFEEIDGGWDDH